MYGLIGLSIEGLTSFSVAPLRLASLLGLLLALAALCFGVSILWETFFYGDSVAGYPSVIVGLMVLGGVQLIMIGVMGEYIGKILSEIKARPVYFVAEHSVRTVQGRSDASSSSRRGRMSMRRAHTDLAVRRRLRHLAGGQQGDPRSRHARAPQRHLGDGGGAEPATAPRRPRSTCSTPARRRVAIGLHVTLTGAVPADERGLPPDCARHVPAARGDARCAARCGCSTARRSPPRSRPSSMPLSRCSGARRISSTAISTCICSRRCARRCSTWSSGTRRDAWVRQCGRAGACPPPRRPESTVSRPAERANSQRAPRRTASRTNPAFAGAYDFRRARRRISRDCFRAFSMSCRRDGVIMCHPGLVDAELVRLDPLTDVARARIRLFCRRRFPARCWPGTASSWPWRNAASAKIRCGAKAVACRSANILRRPYRRRAALPTWRSSFDSARFTRTGRMP